MTKLRPPPGMGHEPLSSDISSVSLTSIANILVTNRNVERRKIEEKHELKYPNSNSSLAVQNNHNLDDISAYEDVFSKQKRSTELAAVANNCALSSDFEAAVQFYTQAISLNETDFRFFCNRSFCYENLKQYDKSLEDAETAIQLNSYRPKPFFRKGRSLIGLKKFEEAEEAFKQVLKRDSECEATKNELMQLRYLALRDIGFDIDAALLSAKRCTSISDAIDFVVNVELLSLKATELGVDMSQIAEEIKTSSSLSSSAQDGNGSSNKNSNISDNIGKLKMKTRFQDNSCLQSFSSTSSINSLPKDKTESN